MRQIELTHHRDKEKKKKRLIIGAVLLFVMFSSVLGFAFQGALSGGGGTLQEDQELQLDEYGLVSNGQLWVAPLGNLVLGFTFHPDNLEITEEFIGSSDSYYGKPLYVYSENSNAEREVYRNFDPNNNQIVLRVQAACPSEEECNNPEAPIKTCDDNFIIIRESEVLDISTDKNCVYIEGPQSELVKNTDVFLYKLFGIV